MRPTQRSSFAILTLLLWCSGSALAQGGKTAPPGSFTLSSPANGATGVSATPALSWTNARKETSYLVQVDAGSAFASPLVAATLGVDVTSYTVPAGKLAASTKYYWRVIAKNAYGQTTASNAPFSFTTAGTPPPPPPAGNYYSRTYGGSADDFVHGMTPASDGGILLAGGSFSYGAGWLVRLRSDATIAWQKALSYGFLYIYNGGFQSVRQTSDGGFFAAGTGPLAANNTRLASLVRLGADGAVLWQKGFIASNVLYAINVAKSVETTTDGGCVVACFGTGPLGSNDYLLSKFNADGTHAWSKAYGTSGSEPLWSMIRTTDPGYLLAGLAPRQFPPNAAMLVKVAADGTRQWSRIYYGAESVGFQSVQQTADGGFIACGKYGTGGVTGSENLLVVKLDGNGFVQWQKTYDVDYSESLECIRQTADGGYVATGRVAKTVSVQIILKLDATGSVVWKKGCQPVFWSASSLYYPALVTPATDGTFRIGGTHGTYNVTPGDFWLTKLDANGNCPPLMSDITVFTSTASITVGDQFVQIADVTPTVIDTAAVVTDTSATVTQKAP